MRLFNFGDYSQGLGYKSVDEHVMRANASIMLLLAIAAFINGFMLQNYIALPFISGFMALNFFIGVIIDPRFAPTMFLAKLIARNKPSLPIGAIQKHFAWSLGLILTSITFILSLLLLGDVSYFNALCILCVFCITLLYYESVFGVCVGCKIYHAALRMKLLKQPDVKPTCMGDSCEV